MKKHILVVILLALFSHPIFSQNFEWAKSIGGSYVDYGWATDIDNSGNVYITGTFSDMIDFDPGTNIFNLTPVSLSWGDIFVMKLDTNGNFIWAKSMGNVLHDLGISIKVDSSGNVYTTGYFEGTVDFDPGVGTHFLTSSGSFEVDIFIQKLDTNGNFVWAKSMGASSSDTGWSIEVDVTGNIYTTGHFKGTVDFDPGTETFNLTSNGEKDIFIQKLDSNGNLIWVKAIGGTGYDNGESVTTSNLGNVYITGSFDNTVDFDPNAGVYNLTALSTFDTFILKLDSSGNFTWAKAIQGTNLNVGFSLKVDDFENIYSAGYFYGTVDFDPDDSSTYNLTSSGSSDIYIHKLDENGNFIWAKAIGGTLDDEARSLEIDDFENIYITGYFRETVDFDPSSSSTYYLTSNGLSDVYILKLDNNGEYIWVKSFGGGGVEACFSISLDDEESIYTTGYFTGGGDFDFGTGVQSLNSNGSWDIFIHKISQSTLSIEDNKTPKRIIVYPNPSSNYLKLAKNDLLIKRLAIIDVLGKEIKVFKKIPPVIDISKLSKGPYFLSLQSEHGIDVIRFIKK